MRVDTLPSRVPNSLPRRSAATSRRSLDVTAAVESWLADGEAQGWSQRTLTDRRLFFNRFVWWLEQEAETPPALGDITADCIRRYLTYARQPLSEGRYASDRPNAKSQARPATVHAYFRMLRAFFNFCLAEGLLEETPLRNVKAPRVPNDQLQPLTREHVQALLDAARQTICPERNRALVLLLLDTGIRVNECARLTIGDYDRQTGQLSVQYGKGGKRRVTYLGREARRALARCIQVDRKDAEPADPLFVAHGGHHRGQGLTTGGIRLVITDCAKLAGLEGVQCSCHSLRRTFSVNYLRSGGNLLELQQLLGHEDLTVLRRYVALAQTDLAQAHRRHSPADNMALR